MGLETATYIQDLVATNPAGGDQKQQGDNHIRLIKDVLRNTFPDATSPIRRHKAVSITGDVSPAAAAQHTRYSADASGGAITVTLPTTLTADDAGWDITVQKTDSSTNAVVFEPGTEQINGLDNVRISSQWTAARIYWTGDTWRAFYSFGYVSDVDPLQSLINRVIPAGLAMFDFAETKPTTGWEYSYGQLLSRTTFPALFARYGTYYGAGDGSTTFEVPDVRGRVIAGKDNMGTVSANRLTGHDGGVNGDNLGGTGGSESHALIYEEMPSHYHLMFDNNSGTGTLGDSNQARFRNGQGVNLDYEITGTSGGADIGRTSFEGDDETHNNVQPTIIANVVIKAH